VLPRDALSYGIFNGPGDFGVAIEIGLAQIGHLIPSS
jgi:hypothetical protein